MAKIQGNDRYAVYLVNEDGQNVGRALASVYFTDDDSAQEAFDACKESAQEFAREKNAGYGVYLQSLKNDGSIKTSWQMHVATPASEDEDLEADVAAIEGDSATEAHAQELIVDAAHITSDCRACGAVAMTSKGGYDHCALCGWIPDYEVDRLEVEAENQYDREYGHTDDSDEAFAYPAYTVQQARYHNLLPSEYEDETNTLIDQITLRELAEMTVESGDDDMLRKRADARKLLKSRLTKTAKTPREQKAYNTNGEKGLIYVTKSRATGAEIKLYQSAQAGIDSGDKYTLVCVTHGAQHAIGERRLGRDNMGDPFYCAECVAIAAEKGITLQERIEKYRGPRH